MNNEKNFGIFDFMELDEEEKKLLEENGDHDWEEHWVGMPEFKQEDNPPYKKIIMSFRSKEDYEEFAKLIDQKLTDKTKSIWYPKLDKDENTLKRWIEE
jgi:hypothetical protein